MKNFKNIIQLHKAIIYKVARAYTDNSFDLKDLYQEIVIQIWKSIDRFKGQSKQSSYIYRIALNTAINFKKKIRKNPSVDISDMNFKDERERDDGREDKLSLLHSAINQLSKDEKAIIILYLDEYSHKEIAEVIGISSNYIGVKVNRIKNKLAEILKDK